MHPRSPVSVMFSRSKIFASMACSGHLHSRRELRWRIKMMMMRMEAPHDTYQFVLHSLAAWLCFQGSCVKFSLQPEVVSTSSTPFDADVQLIQRWSRTRDFFRLSATAIIVAQNDLIINDSSISDDRSFKRMTFSSSVTSQKLQNTLQFNRGSNYKSVNQFHVLFSFKSNFWFYSCRLYQHFVTSRSNICVVVIQTNRRS